MTEDKKQYFKYDDILEPICINDELLSIKALLNKLKKYVIYYKTIDINDILRFSYEFFNQYLKLNNINYFDEKKIYNIYDKSISKDEWIKFYNDNSVIISPLNLPIKIIRNSKKDTYEAYIEYFFGYNKESLEAIKQVPILFSCIKLSSKLSHYTSYSYIHEITHTQIMNNKNVQEYYNKEFLPFLVELISSFESNNSLMELRVLINYLLLKLNSEINYILKQDNIDAWVYIVSRLKALNMFYLYYNSNKEIRKIIVNDIQNIFDGTLGVEEFLKKYNITYENSLKKNLTKK